MAPASSTQPLYGKDEKVLCFHHELLYEAKVLDSKIKDPNDKKDGFMYRIHYKGWKNTYVLSHFFVRCVFKICLLSHPLRLPRDKIPQRRDFSRNPITLLARHQLPHLYLPLPVRSIIMPATPRKPVVAVARKYKTNRPLTRRWDDWVPQERLRKLSEENKELASNLKKDMDAQRRAASGKPPLTSMKKRPYGSDLTSSARGSEDRSSAVPPGPRGTKRGRDIEGIDKVSR